MRIEALMTTAFLMAGAVTPVGAQDVTDSQSLPEMAPPPEALPQTDGELPQAEMPMPDFTMEQQAAFDLFPPDRQTAFLLWTPEVQAYYWELPQAQQDIFWRLSDGDRMALSAMTPEDRAAAWEMIETRIAEFEGPQPEMPDESDNNIGEPPMVGPETDMPDDPDSVPDPM